MVFGPASSLKAQEGSPKVWDSLSEGSFGITNNYQVGDYVVMTTVLDKGIKPAIVNNQYQTQPISVWSLQNDSFVNFSSNWVGDAMDPVRVFKYDSSRLFLTDGIKVVRADIDFQYKTISYEQTFQGNSDSNNILAFFKGKENVYFTSSYGKDFVYICDMLGNIKKTINISNSQNIEWVTSIIEWEDIIYFGYTYVGGLPDGSGLAKLDPVTGQITKIFNQPWKNNLNGCYISIIGGKFYLETDPGLYTFEPSLFEYKDGLWETKVVGALLPEEKNGKNTVWIRPDGHYPNGDTINKTKGGINYDFTNGIVGKMIPKDPRLEIQFSEKFKTSFSQRHAQNMPEISFIYETGQKVIGFGPNIVAQLVDLTSGIKTPKARNVLNIYPNPATGEKVYIQGLQKPTDYTITNATGQIVATGMTMDSIDVNQLSPGIYFVNFLKIGAYARLVKN